MEKFKRFLKHIKIDTLFSVLLGALLTLGITYYFDYKDDKSLQEKNATILYNDLNSAMQLIDTKVNGQDAPNGYEVPLTNLTSLSENYTDLILSLDIDSEELDYLLGVYSNLHYIEYFRTLNLKSTDDYSSQVFYAVYNEYYVNLFEQFETDIFSDCLKDLKKISMY